MIPASIAPIIFPRGSPQSKSLTCGVTSIKKVSTQSQLRFSNALPFSEGLGAVCDGTSWGFVDHAGHVVIPPSFNQVLPFSEGLAAVVRGIDVGYIDHKGKYVIFPKYQSGASFSDGLARVESFREGDNELSVYYINRQGAKVLDINALERKFGMGEAAMD